MSPIKSPDNLRCWDSQCCTIDDEGMINFHINSRWRTYNDNWWSYKKKGISDGQSKGQFIFSQYKGKLRKICFLLQPISSLWSWQSTSPSQWNDLGIHWSPDLQVHSLYRHWDPGELVAQKVSSEPSPQSSSESHLQVLRIQRWLSHWNSFGSHLVPSPNDNM